MLLKRIRIKLEMTVVLICYVIKLCSVKNKYVMTILTRISAKMVKINLVNRKTEPVKMILIVQVY